MEIKYNKTRISLWHSGKRFAKIEKNKLIITNGHSNKNRNLWKTYKFNKIEDIIKILKCYLLERDINTDISILSELKQLNK